MLGNQRRCLGLPINGFKLAVEGVLYIATSSGATIAPRIQPFPPMNVSGLNAERLEQCHQHCGHSQHSSDVFAFYNSKNGCRIKHLNSTILQPN
ncbi:MAG: hypothetical protein CM1200mP18_20360 [Gammaproteobacteria bacterium]|nr:MAG: hypothetical protein CM1200mP18_20360 [Gammaproteobacteria bacterium]